MLQGTVIGPSSTPGQILYSRRDPGPSRDPLNHFSALFQDQQHEVDQPLGRIYQAIEDPHSDNEDEIYQEEELVWYDKTVIWSRGSQVFRKYTYELEKEDVSRAVFAWFKIGDNASTASRKGKQAVGSIKSSETFGPFHDSQNEHWGVPRISSSSSSTNPARLERTLVVFLKSRAHVYYSSGEDIVVHLPFTIDGAWPIESGGLIIQRALEKRELRKLGKEKGGKSNGSLLRGMMDQSSMTILDDLMDLEDDNSPSLPRLYSLENPFDELKMIVEGRVEGGFDKELGKLISQTHPINSSSSILHVTRNPYPFIIAYDYQSGEIIFYRKTTIPDKPGEPSPIPNPRTMRPEELLGPTEPPIPIPIQQPQPSRMARPSLHRNASSFGPTTDRRISNISDPLDRTQRRAPRMSTRGVGLDHPVLTDELQATLDPTPLIPPATTTKRKSRGMSILSTTTSAQEVNRRTSGATSSFVLHDLHDKQGQVGLNAMAEMDLRETTMMMGLERDEVGARSDLVLDRVWVWRVPHAVEAENISVFLSDNLSPSSVVINIHMSQPHQDPQLYSFHAQSRSTSYHHFIITPCPPIECLSAIPIISTRPRIFDTLLLSRNGGLSIMTSSGRQIAFSIPSQAREGHEEVTKKLASSLRMVSDDGKKHNRLTTERKIIKLSDSIGTRFTITYEDGESLRIDGDLRIKHKLTKQCLESLSYVIPAQEFFYLKREVLASIQKLPYIQRNDHKEIWKVFSRIMRIMLQVETESEPTESSDILLKDNHSSFDPIARRLAQRLSKSSSSTDGPSSTELVFGETLQLEHTASIMLALHLVAQDLRHSSTRRKEMSGIVRLISDLASKMGRIDWKDYWARLMPSAVSKLEAATGVAYDTSVLDRFDVPPDILTYLQRQLITRTKTFPSPSSCLPTNHPSELGPVNPCRQTSLITSIYSHFSSRTSITTRAATAVKHIVDQGLGEDWLTDLPYGVAMPILEMIRVCQHNPPKDWDARLYEITGRWDMAVRASGGEGLHEREEPVTGLGPETIPTIKELVGAGEDEKKKPQQPALPHVRFGSDRRVQEVERIMQTTRVRTIAIQDPKGASEADIVRYHQNVVNTIANRTLSIPVGQGMFEFGTRSANITDIWDIPLIELSIKPGPGKPVLKAEIAADSAEWPCFHNGVAAGLAISPDGKGIDSSWIIFNRPNILNAEHGGFLLGLGLTGHLKSLMTYHAFPLLEPRHDFTSVGLLLGLACSYAGSEDLLITKVLSLHTHALLPLGSMGLNASPIIQSSALVGLGLVYAGSRNLRMAELALSEVGRKEMPNVDGFADYQESYSFSAAMAFGLIMLGRGGKTTSEVDRRMLTQLRRCILGDLPIETSKGRNTNIPNIDNNLTGSGATLALGLMYLKSGRKDIADMIPIPQTLFDLDQVRPDLLLLRTFARSLILWDEITPTMGWIEDQLPNFIKLANKGGYKRPNTSNMELSTELAYLNIISGACFAIGIKYAGTATELAHTNLMTFFGILTKASTGSNMTYEGKIRRSSARQGLNIITLALSMVMSGTGELSVLRRLRISHGQEGSGVNYGSHMAMNMSLGLLFLGKGHYTLGNSNLSIACLSISCFPRFLSGPGDNKSYPQAFRHLWALAVEPRCLIAKDIDTLKTVYLPVKLKVKEIQPVKEGEGNGMKKIKETIRQQSLISPTLISPFEAIQSIEIDSPRYWSIKYDLTINSKDRENLIRKRIIYVKRKLGFLDYNSDPKGNRSLFIKVGSMSGIDLHYDLISKSKPPNMLDPNSIKEKLCDLVGLHSGKSELVLLSKLFDPSSQDSNDNKDNKDFSEFIQIVLLECLSLDKSNLIPIYLSMFMDYKNHQSDSGSMMVETLNQIGFMKFFYTEIFEKSFNTPSSTSSSSEKKLPLIRPNFLTSLIRILSQPNSNIPTKHSEIVTRYLLGVNTIWNENNTAVEELIKYIWKFSLPPIQLLDLLRNKVGQSAIDRNVLELKIKDVSETYRGRVMGGYDEYSGVEVGVGGWKGDGIKDAIRVWTE